MKKSIGIIFLIIAILGSVGCGIIDERKAEVDLSPFVDVVLEGKDGEGIAHMDIYDGIIPALLYSYEISDAESYEMLQGKNKKDAEFIRNIETFSKSIKYTLDKETKLRNGDTVLLGIQYDEAVAEAIGLTVKFEREPVVVSELEVLKLFSKEEMKKEADVVINGIYPLVDVSIAKIGKHELSDYVNFSLDEKESKLEDGGFLSVIVTADDAMEDYGYYPEEKSFTFQVPVSLETKYAATAEDISPEYWEKILREFEDGYTAEYYVGSDQSINNKGVMISEVSDEASVGEIKVKEVVILYAKDFTKDIKNQVIVIYEMEYAGPKFKKSGMFSSPDGDMSGQVYLAFYTSDIIVNEEGNSEGSLLEVSPGYSDFDYITVKNMFITKHMGDYNVNEVPIEKLP